jgi:hypothetical protein
MRKSRSPTDDSALARDDDLPMNSADIRVQLTRLRLELIDADEVGLSRNDNYMADLEQEIAECHAVLTLTAVTEMAVAEAEVSGRRFG